MNTIKRVGLLLIVLPIALVMAIAVGLVVFLRSFFIHLAVWISWIPRGVDILLVYSDSPTWKAQIEETLAPLLKTRAVILNTSDRNRWQGGLASMTANYFARTRRAAPCCVLFRPLRRARVFRLRRPFQDLKYGQPETLAGIENEFFDLAGIRQSTAETK
jgi:hypothetical protein